MKPAANRLALHTLDDRTTPAAAGTLDPTFGVGGVVTLVAPSPSAQFTPTAAVALADGRVVIAGSSQPATASSVATPYVERLTADGRLDTSFGDGGFVALTAGTQAPLSLAADSLGRVLFPASGADFGVRRLTADGKPDATFGANGLGAVRPSADPAYRGGVRAISVLPDGRIVLAGSVAPAVGFGAAGTAIAVGRLTPDGQADSAFGGGGVAVPFPLNSQSVAFASAVHVDPLGRIVVAGQALSAVLAGPHAPVSVYDSVAVRLTDAGRLDASFGDGGRVRLPGSGFDPPDGVRGLADGRVVITGQRVIRLTASGQFDASYGGGQPVDLTTPLVGVPTASSVVLPDGRVEYLSRNGIDSRYLRLTADGRPDPAFAGTSLPGVTGNFAPDASGRAAGTRIAFGGTYPSNNVANPAVFRVLTESNPFPTPHGTVSVGGSPDGRLTPLQPLGDGSLLAVPPLAIYPNFPGSVRVATADVNGDGVPDYVTGAGPGGGPNVVVTDGKTGAVFANLNAFEATFTGGVFVAAADIDGDGQAEVVVTPDVGGGPVVAIYDGAKLAAGLNAGAESVRFFGIDDTAFRGGARPALGDVSGDGRPDLIVAAGGGGGPRVAVYDGPRTADRNQWEYAGTTGPKGFGAFYLPPKLVGDFFVFEPTLRNGVFVAAGDLTGDGRAEIVVGGGPGGGPRVLALDGAAVVRGQMTPVANFFAGDAATRGGVRVAVRPAADGSVRLLTGSGAGQPGRVNVYRVATALAGGPADQVVSPFGDAALADGVFVG